jgi:carbamoyl-phosphate synthase large subunit
MNQLDMQFKGKKVLILGSGGLRIGQAGEFDYSGSQAIKALKEEGITTILVNPNVATVQTDPDMADTVYLQPLNIESVSKIIEKEHPDAILLSFGGQTALNLGMELEEKGVLKKYNVDVLGTPIEKIRITEDRDLFKKALAEIEVKTARSFAVHTIDKALEAALKIGYPIMIRSAFSLGGLGSGRVNNEKELKILAKKSFQGSSQILVEEFLGKWKEVEYEIVRDQEKNTITVCNMENMDPMGIHTGESIVVAPSQTLTNKEYHNLREIAIKTACHLGIIGECNIQYALNPQNGDYRVIEVNARLSRSSALASKATGYPLAFVAAKIAVGYPLYKICNSVTKSSTAFFEPALDYIVVKIPRWDTHKLKNADHAIGSEMKSVGEVMAIGRSFPEALQKAIRMVNSGSLGFTDHPHLFSDPKKEIKQATDRRLFAIYEYLKQGGSVEQIQKMSRIHPWFLHHLKDICCLEDQLHKSPLTKELLVSAKKMGFGDATIAKIVDKTQKSIRSKRLKWGITPFIKQIDTTAGEFNAQTNYLYTTYHGQTHDIDASESPITVILGSGPYSIGSSVEFDWCGVNTARTLKSLGKTTAIINSNPETVSTDFDESNRLYFEELSLERIQDIADFENLEGIIVCVGGQTANTLAPQLAKENYPILGTDPINIDKAENRKKFSSLLHTLNIDQPDWQEITTIENAYLFANQVGFPILARPSYVLSGAAMKVVYNKEELKSYLHETTILSSDFPTVLSQFISNAKELEIDGVADQGKVIIEAISEHVENAGVHSGDATIVLPPQNLYLETIRRTKQITKKIAKALEITGPFNIQFIAKNNEIKVIECNVRASRSFPFVSKVTGHNFIKIATEIFCKKYIKRIYNTLELNYVGIKTPQFSYNRLKGADPVAHVEMASTGEVACIGDNYLEAFLSSWLATEQKIAKKKLLLSIASEKIEKFIPYLTNLEANDWEVFATEGTHRYLAKRGIGSICLYKPKDNLEPNIVSFLDQKEIDLIINIPTQDIQQNSSDGYFIRRTAIDYHIPLITNTQLATLFLLCLSKIKQDNLPVKSLNEYINH